MGKSLRSLIYKVGLSSLFGLVLILVSHQAKAGNFDNCEIVWVDEWFSFALVCENEDKSKGWGWILPLDI